MIPAAAYAMIFLWGSIMISIEIPQLFPALFGFNTQQVGLQNISIIIGSLLGEQVGGYLSDRWMWIHHRETNKLSPPEFRLWLSYIGHLLTICGVVVFLVQIDRATNRWNVTPLIGAGIAAAGNQIVTTVMITYAVDCYREDAASVGVFITFTRQVWGFIGPFWYVAPITILWLDLLTNFPQVSTVTRRHRAAGEFWCRNSNDCSSYCYPNNSIAVEG